MLPPLHCNVGLATLAALVLPLGSRIWYMTRTLCGRASRVVPSLASIVVAAFFGQLSVDVCQTVVSSPRTRVS